MLKVYFAGLMYFHGCDTTTKRVHVPDGTKGMSGQPPIPPHYASLWIHPGLVKTADWFAGHQTSHEVSYFDESGDPATTSVVEFGIPDPVTLTFPDDAGGGATFVNLAEALRRIEDLADPGPFVVDHDAAERIVEIPLRSGSLEAFAFTQNVAVIQWTIPTPGVTITADAAGGPKTITLESGANAEIVFGNTSDLLKESRSRRALRSVARAGATPVNDTHYRLYSKLRAPRKVDDIVWRDVARTLAPLDYQHPYLAHIHTGVQIPDPGCEGTCC